MTAQMKSELTRQRILQAAREAFMRSGMNGASMRGIANALSMKEGSIYYYFSGKSDLYKAVIEDALDEFAKGFVEVQGEDSEPVQYLLQVGLYYSDQLSLNRSVSALLAMEAFALPENRAFQLDSFMSTMAERVAHVSASLASILDKDGADETTNTIADTFLSGVFGAWALKSGYGATDWKTEQRTTYLRNLASACLTMK